MPRARSYSRIVDRNGDVWEKRVIRHDDGTTTLRRTKVGCGIVGILKKNIPGAKATPAKIGERLTRTEILKQNRGDRSAAKRALSARPKVITDRFHEVQTEFDGTAYVKNIKPAYVQTTNLSRQALKKAKARTGDHIDLFIRDVEIVSSALRSVNLDGVRGGSRVPIPMAQIQAQERINEFEERHPRSFMVCKVLLVRGCDPKDIPVPPDMKKRGGRNRLIQESIDDLANFYTPRRRKPNAALIRFVDEVETALLKDT